MSAELRVGQIEEDAYLAVTELAQVAGLTANQILVVGASSSEVIGKKIGTSGSLEVAKALVNGILRARQPFGFHLAFQGCEHINRALTIERQTMETFGLEEVMVIPVSGAGGAVAATAYRYFSAPVVVEEIQAHAGIDIGSTLIGMHLRRVAVPVRMNIRWIGEAAVTAARTRPKLIGGKRAIYSMDDSLPSPH